MKYTAVVPRSNRKYKVTVGIDTVQDFESTAKKGPSSAYTFYSAVGDIKKSVSSASTPTVSNYMLGSTLYGAKPSSAPIVGAAVQMTLFFNEDVQKGVGTISFCTTSAGTCTLGMMGSSPATFEVNGTMDNVVMDKRSMALPSLTFSNGQTLYPVLPAGLVKDVSAASTDLAELATSSSGLRMAIVPTESSKPVLQMISPAMTSTSNPTIALTDTVTLYFSEAVQAFYGANISTSAGIDASYMVTTTISDSAVTLAPTVAWTLGTKYVLNMDTGAFKDLVGNVIDSTLTTDPPSLAMSGAAFTAINDAAGPTIDTTSYAAASATRANPTDPFELLFNEVVQLGTGSIVIYSGPATTSTGGDSDLISTGLGSMLQAWSASDLPVFQVLQSGKLTSYTTVTPTDAMLYDTNYKLAVSAGSFKDVYGNAIAATTTNEKRVNDVRDCEDPKFLFAQMGTSTYTSPALNYAAAGDTITMYFSENVQTVATGSVYLKSSNGGSYCSAVATTQTPAPTSYGAGCTTAM